MMLLTVSSFGVIIDCAELAAPAPPDDDAVMVTEDVDAAAADVEAVALPEEAGGK